MTFFVIAATFGALCLTGFLLIGFLLKLVFWVVFLPFRILFKILFGVGGLLLGAVVAPLLVVVLGAGLVVAVVGALLAIVLPLLPVMLLAFVGWAIYRGTRRRESPVV